MLSTFGNFCISIQWAAQGMCMEGPQCEFDCYLLLHQSSVEKIGIPILEAVEPFILPDSLAFVVVSEHTMS